MGLNCPICFSKSLQQLADKVRYDMDRQIYKCLDCQIVFLHPKMRKEEVSEYYKKEYRELFLPLGKTVEEHFRNSLPEAHRRKKMIEHLLQKDVKVLEIGCSAGYFLHAIKKLVAEVHGVEPNIKHREYAVQIGIQTYPSYEYCPQKYYDIITLFFSFEHMCDPINALLDIKKLLKDKGMLIIEIPNVDDILISRYKINEFKQFYWQAPHSWYFSKETLQNVLGKAGYSSEIVPVQRYDISNHIIWMLERRPGGNGYFDDIFDDDFKNKYNEILKRYFLCDTLMSFSKIIVP